MIIAELVDGCKLTCRMCWNNKRRGSFKNMPLEIVEQIIDKYRDEKRIDWHNWGEPLLHNDFVKVSEILKGTFSRVSSSLSLQISDEKLEALNNFSEVIISLSGYSPSVYSMYHIGGDFQLVLKNMERLAKIKKIPVSVQWLIHPLNKHQIKLCTMHCAMYGFGFIAKGLNIHVEDQIAGVEDEFLKDYATEREVCYLFKDTIMDVDGDYLVCCATENVKIGLNIRDNVCHEEIEEARNRTEICQKCQEKEHWRMY